MIPCPRRSDKVRLPNRLFAGKMPHVLAQQCGSTRWSRNRWLAVRPPRHQDSIVPELREQSVSEPASPLILVTNDDGIGSPGLHAAIAAVQPLGEMIIAAPRWQQSSAGRSLPAHFTGRIFEEEVRIGDLSFPAYAVEGSPAQVVQHAILELAPRLPDLVVSGINYGENLGNGITVSGTVGAVLEGAAFGVKGLAASLGVDKRHHLSHSTEVGFEVAAHFTAFFARLLLAQGLPLDVDLIKVDVPADATVETEWRVTRVSRRRYFVPFPSRRADLSLPGPLDYASDLDLDQLEPDSDIYAFIVDQVVSVSPISLDLTARVALKTLENELRSAG
jgi:5'-nucleotidase